MFPTRFSLALMWSVVAAPLAVAQTAQPAAPATLTVAQAIDEAVQRNLSLLAERSNLSIAETAMLTARLRPNPVASFSADHLDWLPAPDPAG